MAPPARSSWWQTNWPAVAERVGFPCVLKPVRGEGSRSTFRVDTAEQGAALITRLLGRQQQAR
jgi:biotin carboxylase